MNIITGLSRYLQSSAPDTDASSRNVNNSRNRSGFDAGVDSSSRNRKSGDRNKQQHSVVSSALWALARTPQLLNAVEYEETRDGGEKQLSSILKELARDEILTDSTLLRREMRNAETYLAACHMQRFESMEPLDAMRGIVGLCADSQAVLEQAAQSVYYKQIKCSKPSCAFDTGSRETEVELRCTRQTVQKTVDLRFNALPKVGCRVCRSVTASESWKMDVAPGCFIASWKRLGVSSQPVKDILQIPRARDCAPAVFGFRLNIIITEYQKHLGCMFRHGNNYYVGNGYDAKEMQKTEWLNARPVMVIYTRDTAGDVVPTLPVSLPRTSTVSQGRFTLARDTIKRRRTDGKPSGVLPMARRKAGEAPPEVIDIDGVNGDSEVEETSSLRPSHEDLRKKNNSREAEVGGREADDGLGALGRRYVGQKRDRREARSDQGTGIVYLDVTSQEEGGSRRSDVRGSSLSRYRRPLDAATRESPRHNDFIEDISVKSNKPVVSSLAIVQSAAGRLDGGEPERLTPVTSLRPPPLGFCTATRTGKKRDDFRRKSCRGELEECLCASKSRGSTVGTVTSTSSPCRVGDEVCGHDGLDSDKQKRQVASVSKPTDRRDVASSSLVVNSTLAAAETAATAAAAVVKIAAAAAAGAVAAVTSAPSSHRQHSVPLATSCSSAAKLPPGHLPPSSTSKKVEVHDVEEVVQDGGLRTSSPIENSFPAPRHSSALRRNSPPTQETAVEWYHSQLCKYKMLSYERYTKVTGRSAGSSSEDGGGVGNGRAGGGRNQTLDACWEKTPTSNSIAMVDVFSDGESTGKAGKAGKAEREAGRSACNGGGEGGSSQAGEGSSHNSRPVTHLMEIDISKDDSLDVVSSKRDEDHRAAVTSGDGKGRGSGDRSGKGASGETKSITIRGIQLPRDQFCRILDRDGWLTSQIIDIRIKQLQEAHPENLYFDTSFFSFLCSTTEKDGSFVVNYGRVQGWTKPSKLPAGKSSLFDMNKLFVPINQGNVHWVLVVVDIKGQGGAETSIDKIVIAFYDSYGREGAVYVQAIQEYLVRELSSRNQTRGGHLETISQPPNNAPLQFNSSDCGVLMLYVMERLSTGTPEALSNVSPEEVMRLRYRLMTDIRE